MILGVRSGGRNGPLQKYRDWEHRLSCHWLNGLGKHRVWSTRQTEQSDSGTHLFECIVSYNMSPRAY